MDKTYNPDAIEQRWYQQWEQNGEFKPSGEVTPYAIMLPPPNVTGSLHMGHGFNNTIMDLLTRYHRMKGDNTLWQPGTDHAGIATQMGFQGKGQPLASGDCRCGWCRLRGIGGGFGRRRTLRSLLNRHLTGNRRIRWQYYPSVTPSWILSGLVS